MTGAPHLARFSRDVGFHKPRPLSVKGVARGGGAVDSRGIPHLPKSGRYPYFLYAVPKVATCAAFIKESRMEFLQANQLHRKYGVWGTSHWLRIKISLTDQRFPRGSVRNAACKALDHCLISVRAEARTLHCRGYPV